MRYFLPLLVVIGIATLLPNNPFALAGYIAVALYSVLQMTGMLRKASPERRRPILIGSVGALGVALGLGAFLYFH